MATFAERLRELRNEKGLSQAELASQLGVAMNTVSIWELGERLPRDRYIESLADSLDTSMTYLMGVTDEGKHPQTMTDEETAEIADAEEQEVQEHMMKLYRDLSSEMQDAVRITISSMWKAERGRGKLRSQQIE